MGGNVVVVNEVLCFIQNNYVKVTRNELSAAVVSFYLTEEVVAAKNCLYDASSGAQIEDIRSR